MKTFLLITVIILWVALRSYASNAKRKADQEKAAAEPSQPSYSSVRSAFESLFEDEEETKAESARSSFAQEEEKAGYYSYESVEPEVEPEYTRPQADFQPKRAPRTRVTETEEEPAAVDFDLRQAVIYQTILSNKYLDEMHSAEN